MICLFCTAAICVMRLVERERATKVSPHFNSLETALSNAGHLYTVYTFACPAIPYAQARADPSIRLSLLSHGKTAEYPLREASK